MKTIWTAFQAAFTTLGGVLGWFFGGADGFFFVLLAFVVADYITGVMVAVSEKKLSSAVGFRGIFRKIIYNQAVLLFAKLCRDYSLDPLKPGVIISHKEGFKLGVASNHGDPEHLWTGLGLPYSMDTFRAAVKAEIEHQLTAEAATQQPTQQSNANQPIEPEQPNPALDNTPSSWAKEAVEWGKSFGFLTGDGTGNLLLHSPITREQFIMVLYHLEQIKNK